jgi:hypothetical protein
MPIFSAALDHYGLEFAAAMQTSAEEGSINTGLQAATLIANVGAFYLDGGFDDLAKLGNQFYDEASSGAVGFVNAFGEVTGSVSLGGNLGLYAPLAGLDITSDYYGDDFSTLADPNGNYLDFVPLNDPKFDYNKVDIIVVDPESGVELGSVNVNLNTLSTQTPFGVGKINGTCSDDDAGSPDDDDPDCDNAILLPRLPRRLILADARDGFFGPHPSQTYPQASSNAGFPIRMLSSVPPPSETLTIQIITNPLEKAVELGADVSNRIWAMPTQSDHVTLEVPAVVAKGPNGKSGWLSSPGRMRGNGFVPGEPSLSVPILTVGASNVMDEFKTTPRRWDSWGY